MNVYAPKQKITIVSQAGAEKEKKKFPRDAPFRDVTLI